MKPEAATSEGKGQDMAKAVVKRDYKVSADELWAVVGDFGNTAWVQGASDTEIEGSGVGMVRVFKMGDDPGIREKLETIDHASRTLTYSIGDNLPMPVKNYMSKMVVTAAGDGCQLEWSCTCDPDGVSEEEAAASVEGMSGAMTGWIADLVEKA